MKNILLFLIFMPSLVLGAPYTLHLIGADGTTRDVAVSDPSLVDGFNCKMTFYGDADGDGNPQPFDIITTENCPTMSVWFVLDGLAYAITPTATSNLEVYDGFNYMPGFSPVNCHRASGGTISTSDPAVWFADGSAIGLGSGVIEVIPDTFDWYIVTDSYDGDIVCNGGIPFTPPTPDLIFRTSFE